MDKCEICGSPSGETWECTNFIVDGDWVCLKCLKLIYSIVIRSEKPLYKAIKSIYKHFDIKLLKVFINNLT